MVKYVWYTLTSVASIYGACFDFNTGRQVGVHDLFEFSHMLGK